MQAKVCTPQPDLLLVYTVYLNIATEREVLPEGMAFKAVVREDPAEVRMVGEKYTKHVPHLITCMYVEPCH